MDFGLALPQGAHNDLQRDVIKVAKRAEEAGFDSLWAYERVLFPVNPTGGMYGVDGLAWLTYYEYCADPLTVLTLAGAVTEKVRLGTSVLIAPLHSKLHLARTLATLDQATGGRVLGGGMTKRAFRRIAEKGDGWLPVNMPGKDIAAAWRQLLDQAASAGRDPAALRLVPVAPYTVVTDKPLRPDRELFQGTPEQLMEDFAAIAEAGAHELVIGLDNDAASAGELLDKAMRLLTAATAAGLRRTGV